MRGGNPLFVGCKAKSGDIFCSSEMFFIELINIPISLQGTGLKTKLENVWAASQFLPCLNAIF
ncbi:hypothetical protein GH733_009671 [Mirounga leonina]|nr:hypothetical protein GH733_009671 [Mirounga leonina]